jgi:hypothetical protein
MKVIYNTLIMALALLSVGCASIVSKSDYPVTFDSNPSGAEISIVNKKGKEIFKGKTPYTATLPADSGFFSSERYDVTANKEGYHEAKGTLSAGMDGWYLGNILFGGLIGIIIVDPATGAMFKLDDEFTINLQETTKTPAAPTPKP